MKSSEVREQMANALTLDLVGPVSDLPAGAHLVREILPGTSTPSRWYLTGFLAPFESNIEDKSDEDSGEQMDLIPKATGVDDEAAPEASSTRKTPYPSSIGMSVLLPKGTRKITATVTWGDYRPVEDKEQVSGWQRKPKSAQVEVPIAGAKAKYRVPDSDGLEIVPSIREVPSHRGLELVPPGTMAVSIFVVNNRDPQPARIKDTAYAFQVKLQLESDRPFVPRPNLRGLLTEDPDERIADLQYRDAMEFAVGHGTSAHANVDSRGIANWLNRCGFRDLKWNAWSPPSSPALRRKWMHWPTSRMERKRGGSWADLPRSIGIGSRNRTSHPTRSGKKLPNCY